MVVVHASIAMDADNGDGPPLRNLPCIMRLNQLSCTGPGTSFPTTKISSFIDDNKALLRRMFGEQQQPRTVTKTTLTIVRSFGHTRYLIICKFLNLSVQHSSGNFDSFWNFFSILMIFSVWPKNNFHKRMWPKSGFLVNKSYTLPYLIKI